METRGLERWFSVLCPALDSLGTGQPSYCLSLKVGAPSTPKLGNTELTTTTPSLTEEYTGGEEKGAPPATHLLCAVSWVSPNLQEDPEK